MTDLTTFIPFIERTVKGKYWPQFPPMMQLKSKNAGALKELLLKCDIFFNQDLHIEVEDLLSELSDQQLTALYHGFILDRPNDRVSFLLPENATGIESPMGLVSDKTALVIILILTACLEDPIQICTRSVVRQTERWLMQYRLYLSHRLLTLLTKSKNAHLDIT